MGGLNWSRDRDKRRVRERGVEAAGDTIGMGDEDLIATLLRNSPHRPIDRTFKPRPSKAQLREEAAALLDVTDGMTKRIVRCTCGHSAPVEIPASRRGVVTLRCTKCQAPVELNLGRRRR